MARHTIPGRRLPDRPGIHLRMRRGVQARAGRDRDGALLLHGRQRRGYPFAGLIADSAGNLYGTTEYGGTSTLGVVFKLAPPTPPATSWTETVLYYFCSLSNCSDGKRAHSRHRLPTAPATSMARAARLNLGVAPGAGGHGVRHHDALPRLQRPARAPSQPECLSTRVQLYLE